MQISDQGDFGNHNNTGVKIVYQYFQTSCIVMDVYLLMCVITTGNV